MHKAANAVVRCLSQLSVRPFVCPPVTFMDCVKYLQQLLQILTKFVLPSFPPTFPPFPLSPLTSVPLHS